jgi:hypothetical protein
MGLEIASQEDSCGARTTLAFTRKGRLKMIGREAAAPRALCRVQGLVIRLHV